jgi:hypothetical protein
MINSATIIDSFTLNKNGKPFNPESALANSSAEFNNSCSLFAYVRKQYKLFVLVSIFSFCFKQTKANGESNFKKDTIVVNQDFLLIDTSANISIAAGSSMQVFGHITNNGSVIGSGKLSLNGSDIQLIGGIGSINNLIIDNPTSVMIGELAMQTIKNYLQLKSGTLYTSQNLVLNADSLNTASVGPVIGNIYGNVIAEKYLPAKKAYHLLTAPVNSSISIHDNWQEGANSNTDNPHPGYGTFITGSITDQQNGFDGTLSGTPSLFLFDVNKTNDWNPVANTNVNSFTAGNGYRLLFNGDRSNNINNPTAPKSSVLRAIGALTVGPVIFTANTPTALGVNPLDFGLIGNPYASSIDWNLVAKTNIGQTYYSWNSKLKGSTNMGAFVAYNSLTGVSSNSLSSITNIIPSGSAFFVQTRNTNPAISFDESNKIIPAFTNTIAPGGTTPIVPAILPNLSFLLFTGTNANNNISADGAVVCYSNQFSNDLADEDAIKLNNPDENIVINSNNKALAIEGRTSINSATDSVQLYLYNLLPQDYNLQVTAQALNFVGANEAYLVDKLSGTEYPIDVISGQINVPFTSTSFSTNSDRFYVKFNSTNNNSNGSGGSGSATNNPPVQIIVPSPVTSMIGINYSMPANTNFSIRLLSMDGKKLFTQNVVSSSQGQINIPVSNYAQGIYLVEIQIANRRIIKKIIKD